MTIHAYVRVSTDKQETENQRGEIRRYIEEKKLAHVDEWHDINISSGKSTSDRKIEALILSIKEGDLLICTEMTRLGRSTAQLLNIVDNIIGRGGRIVFIKNNIDVDPTTRDNITTKVMLTVFSLMAEVERDFIRQRIKEALKTKKDNGATLGRKKGAIVASKYDKYAGDIIRLLNVHGAKWTKLLTILDTLHPDELQGTRQSIATWVNAKCEKGLGDLWSLKG